jgi:hypothetical protein
MARPTVAAARASIFAMIVVAGCGGAGTSQGSAIPPSASPSAAPIGPSSSVRPVTVLPADAREVEALLPDQICGSPSDKRTIGGDEGVKNSDDDFKAILQGVGKKASDVSVALATTSGSGPRCSVTIIRITGADPALLQETFLKVELMSRHVYVRTTVAGREVWFADSTGGLTWVIFSGDAIIAAIAQDEAAGAAIVAQLP